MRALVLTLALVGCASKPTYEPAADKEGIRGVVRSHLPDAKACYLEAIEARPGADGKIVMEWKIAADGRATDVHVKSAGPRIEVIGPCLVKKISDWQFPKPSKDELEVDVSYPFFFSENGNFKSDLAAPPADGHTGFP